MLLDGCDAAVVERAARALAAGELVAFPTETVYGLGANADDDAASAKVFAAKGRPPDHPLIVHVADAADAASFAAAMPANAVRLMDAFWPGPLTVIVRRAAGRAHAAAGGLPTIGLRCPSHPVAHALLAAAKAHGVTGVAAPSANRFGRISPTLAAHVAEAFDAALLVLDGGACEVGIESSIVDCSGERAMLLRPGVISRSRIEAALADTLHRADASAPRAPGTLAAHYAPRATLRLMPPTALAEALQSLTDSLTPSAPALAVYSRSVGLDARVGAMAGIRHRRMPSSPEQAAHELFLVLHELDTEGVQLIWVEEPPPGPEWDGVRDRLQRAAAA